MQIHRNPTNDDSAAGEIDSPTIKMDYPSWKLGKTNLSSSDHEEHAGLKSPASPTLVSRANSPANKEKERKRARAKKKAKAKARRKRFDSDSDSDSDSSSEESDSDSDKYRKARRASSRREGCGWVLKCVCLGAICGLVNVVIMESNLVKLDNLNYKDLKLEGKLKDLKLEEKLKGLKDNLPRIEIHYGDESPQSKTPRTVKKNNWVKASSDSTDKDIWKVKPATIKKIVTKDKVQKFRRDDEDKNGAKPKPKMTPPPTPKPTVPPPTPKPTEPPTDTLAPTIPSPEERQWQLYKATKAEFESVMPWKNSSLFTTVSRTVFHQLAEDALRAAKPVVDDVYTSCEIYLMPPNEDEGAKKDEAWKPRVQFKCLGKGNDSDSVKLQDKMCHTANICKVVFDEEAWEKELKVPLDLGYKKYEAVEAARKHRVHPKKSAILMMVGDLDYLTQDDVFKATLNKASYAYRSSHSFYLWIGELKSSVLDKREIESVGPALGARCADKHLPNSMHYYKPIAFLVLLDMLPKSHSTSIFYMDADAEFTTLAFEHMDNRLNYGIGPESYLEVSPQASLLATQNIKGKMLMNSGIMLLRNTRWARELSAIWWHARCGPKDQLGLWIALFASLSAWTTDVPSDKNKKEAFAPTQYSYPGQIFYTYESAIHKTFGHFRNNGHKIQAAWEEITEHQKKNGGLKNDSDGYNLPIPTNTKLYNGGTYPGLLPILRGAMELPHFVIAPQAPIRYNYDKAANATGDENANTLLLLRLKSEDGNSFVAHSKALESCSKQRCWPFLSEK